MRRTLVSLLALLFLLPGTTTFAARAQDDDLHMLDLPILVTACERDPGKDLNPGGGRFNPADVMREHGCAPAEGVSVTVSHRPTDEDDLDFFARCETDEDGMCAVNAPADPERTLTVALHMSTVAPGYAPAEPTTSTVHYSEFTGVGIAVLPNPELGGLEIATLPERRTLAMKIEQDGKPAEMLTQLSDGEVTNQDAAWLATNDEGWVSYDLGLIDADTVDLTLNLNIETPPGFHCSEVESGAAVPTHWIEGFEGNFFRITLPDDSDGNINCGISLPTP